jgi:hypothetical protein
MLRRLIYVSTARRLMSDQELIALLRQARENNARFRLTGLLLYVSGNFIQMLEGEPIAVADLYARIARDPRHHTCIPMLDEEAEGRLFPEWSMAFRPSNELSVSKRREIGDFLAVAASSETPADGRPALRLMESFCQSMR